MSKPQQEELPPFVKVPTALIQNFEGQMKAAANAWGLLVQNLQPSEAPRMQAKKTTKKKTTKKKKTRR